VLETIIGVAGNVLIKILDKFSFQHKGVPRHTLRLVLIPRGAWWHMGSSDGKPAMQIVCEWHVTNVTDIPIVVTTAFVKKPRAEATLPLVRHPRDNVFGSYRIAPKDTTRLALDFWVAPPACNEDETFKATIIVKDQFGNEHKVRSVEFKYR